MNQDLKMAETNKQNQRNDLKKFWNKEVEVKESVRGHYDDGLIQWLIYTMKRH